MVQVDENKLLSALTLVKQCCFDICKRCSQLLSSFVQFWKQLLAHQLVYLVQLCQTGISMFTMTEVRQWTQSKTEETTCIVSAIR